MIIILAIKQENPLGGFGSGRKGSKSLTTNMFNLDIHVLQRDGFLRPGPYTPILLGTGYLDQTGLMKVDASLEFVQLSYVYIAKCNDNPPTNISIQLSWTPCHFGGNRPWFLCPACNQRVGILYGDRYFYCRSCWGLAYPVENENSFSRLVRKAKGVRAQLRYDSNLIKPLRYSRPKGMHWEKYIGLLYKALFVEKSLWSYIEGNPVPADRQ